MKGPGASMSQVAGLPNNSYKPITNTAWVRAWLCKLQKGFIRLAAASDKVYQLLAHGQWISPGTLASSTTKTGRHDNIAEILLKMMLKTKNHQRPHKLTLNITLSEYRQSIKMDNPEKLPKHDTQVRRRQINQKHNTICVGHHYTKQTQKNVNKT